MQSLQRVANALQSTFETAVEVAAKSSQVVKRQRKFTPVTLAQSFIMAMLAKPDAGAEEIAVMASAVGVEVSPQAVQQRYSESFSNFFMTLFQQMLGIVVASDQILADLLERFTEVRLIDSSVIALPESQREQYPGCGGKVGVKNAALKLQTELDLRTGNIQSIQIEPGNLPDQGTDRQHVRPMKGSLRITDLGYFNLSVFAMIAAAGAYFLSRMQYTVRVRIDGDSVSLIDWLNQQTSNTVDRWIHVGTKKRLHCRLIAWRVPEEVANRRRQRMIERYKDKGRTPTAKALASCHWEYLITNLTTELASFKEAIILYRSRWQIELLFKRWKSYGRIDLLDGKSDLVTMCRLWIRLCTALVQHWLITAVAWSQQALIGFAKVAKMIQTIASELASSLIDPNRLIGVLEKLQRQALRGCRRTKRRKKPGTIELLNNPDLLEYCLT